MKILYATYRYNPKDPDLGSSVDHDFFNTFIEHGHNVQIIGPVDKSQTIIERVERKFWHIYKRITKKNGLKFPITTALKASIVLKKAIKKVQPDLVFSIFPSFFVFQSVNIPAIWRFDTTFLGQEATWPLYGNLALRLSIWEEKKAISHVSRIITASEWSKVVLEKSYHINDNKVHVFPMPSSLPMDMIPKKEDILPKIMSFPIKFLIVAKVYKRKGVDIALHIIDLLNKNGIPAVVRICGLADPPISTSNFIEFVGPYKKGDPIQLEQYMEQYRWAHFLLHPARFEAAGIVPAEAAAFGTPTLTNDTGGLATSVKHGVSGVVLPKGSPPEAYVEVIKDLIQDPARYHALCRSTRGRYEQELNWQVVGAKINEVLTSLVNTGQ